MCFFAERNEKPFSIVGWGSAELIQANTVLDTGTGPNIIQKRKTDHAWQSYIQSAQSPRGLDASERVMNFCGLTHLTVRIAEFRARVPFLVVQTLAVDCLSKISFIGHHVKSVLSGLLKSVFFTSLLSQSQFNNPITNREPFSLLNLKTDPRNYEQLGKKILLISQAIP